jgi:hypothetical protein
MNRFLIPGVLAGLVAITMAVRFIPEPASTEVVVIPNQKKKTKTLEERALFSRARLQYEYDMLKDPVTGKLPAHYRQVELAAARLIPERVRFDGEVLMQSTNTTNTTTNNTYLPAGPTNVGGRTRALAYDKRFGTTNSVILTGGVSGGIFRSTDGGANWSRVGPQDSVHNVTTIAQDPRTGQQDTWYVGGGEPIGASAEELGAMYLGFGIWKSTDNGATWTKHTQTIPGVVFNPDNCRSPFLLECFDHPFDMVHKILVHPVTGHVYVASHRRLIRSANGGTSWEIVFQTPNPSTKEVGQMDIVCTDAGKMYLALNGGNPDGGFRGIWTSNTGNSGSWTTRIAGGTVLGTDSVAGWRGNDYNGTPRRIMLALAPSSQNILYVTYENGLDHSATLPRPEVDLFKYDATAAPANAWTNLSANVPDWPGNNREGIDPFNTQFGYNLTLAVHPINPDIVFLGGVNLFRSTNGFANTSTTAWIGGYAKNMSAAVYGNSTPDITKWSHPDIHNLVFDPSNSNRAICANDGGLQVTQNITAGDPADAEPVAWTVMSNYQTLQYYRVTIDPEEGRLNFAGGSQDNGTRFRDNAGLLTSPTNNNQFRILGGDGGAAALAKLNGGNQDLFCSSQYGKIYRVELKPLPINSIVEITPNNATAIPGTTDLYGEFVTNFRLDQDNTEDLYYVNFNRLFRTKNASTVTRASWEDLDGVGDKIDPNGLTGGVEAIRAVELSRGQYFPSHVLYIGTTGGHVYRLNNPRNASLTAQPVDITPPGILEKGVIIDIASNPNNDEEIIIVASNYYANGIPIVNIWWTNNAKASSPAWRNAEGNLHALSIRSCAIVVKKDAGNNPVTEYYIGTSAGLYSASNIGALLQAGTPLAWAREGGDVLGYAVISSLAYRPQDNILLVGTHGNGMYYANVGTTDFRPNQNTGVNDPIRNDDNFIQSAVPTITNGTIEYRIGNMFNVRRLEVQVYSMNGHLVMSRETGYLSGSLNVQKLAKGPYILTITSNDYKHQFVQKFVKE